MSENTMSVEPDGRLSASLFVCTTRPSSKIPSSVEVFMSSDVAVVFSPPAEELFVSISTLPSA